MLLDFLINLETDNSLYGDGQAGRQVGGIEFWQLLTYRGKVGVCLVGCGLDGRAACVRE